MPSNWRDATKEYRDLVALVRELIAEALRVRGEVPTVEQLCKVIGLDAP